MYLNPFVGLRIRYQSTQADERSLNDLLKACTESIVSISSLIDSLESQTDWTRLAVRQQQYEQEISSIPSDDWQRIAKTQQSLAKISTRFSLRQSMRSTFDELESIHQLSISANDHSFSVDVLKDLSVFAEVLKRRERDSLMSGDSDKAACMIEIRAGSGGLEACDLVGMLVRMYLRWAEGAYPDGERTLHLLIVTYKDGIIESNPDTLGFKSVSLKLEGEYAYGMCKYESGVHRMVRHSKTDPSGRRHTTFASIQVLPFGESDTSNEKQVEINPRDLKVETMKSQGAGGQHVNKTESAIRLTHLPTGITVSNERSQHQNRATAMKVLKSRLMEREMRKQAQNKAEQYAELPDNAWGNHIRTYVLHPYQLVKDTRSNHETADVHGVLEGALDGFLNASLVHFMKPDTT